MSLLHTSHSVPATPDLTEDDFTERRLQRSTDDLLRSRLVQAATLAELKASEKRLQALISASSDAVYRMSADWTEMYHLRGQPGQPNFLTETLEPRPNWIGQYIHPDDQPRVREAIQTAIQTKAVFELEHRVYRADGGLGWTQSRAVPVIDDDGNISEWFGMAADITSRKLSDAALLESEKLAAVGRLAGSVAHELYNPLDAIRNILWLLQSDNSVSPENSAYLKLAEEEVTRVVDLVRQNLSPFDTNDVRLGT